MSMIKARFDDIVALCAEKFEPEGGGWYEGWQIIGDHIVVTWEKSNGNEITFKIPLTFQHMTDEQIRQSFNQIQFT